MMTAETPTSPQGGPSGILPARPERRAWPWAILFAIGDHGLSVLRYAGVFGQKEVPNYILVGIQSVAPVALGIGLVLIVMKRSFLGRVLIYGALFSYVLVVVEVVVTAAGLLLQIIPY
jgi:hypothetical protein